MAVAVRRGRHRRVTAAMSALPSVVLRAVTTTPVQDTPNPPVFSAGARWGVSAAAVVGGAVIVGLSDTAPAGTEPTDSFVMAHGLAAAPFLVVGAVCTWRALALGPPEYRVFWRRWLAATITGTLAAAATIASVATHTRALLYLDMALMVAAIPMWVSATVYMARAQAGRRSVSIDLVDALTALLVLGTPAVLLVAGPLADSEKLGFAIPFAVTAVFAPAAVYLSSVSLARIPRGERAAQGIGVALGAAAGVNVTMHLARVLGGLELPLRAFVFVHVINMGLFAVTPLWAHRRTTGQQAPAHAQVRRTNPMPYISAVALPLLGVYVFATRDQHAWGVWFLLAVVVAVVLLNAMRYTAMSRETRRLYTGITHMAEERRLLLARMLRGLETDHHRTATELHSQAVGSLATLGTLVQMAHVALPSDTAVTVKETIAALQGDLAARAEHLRQLMLAIRPPALDVQLAAAGLDAPATDDTLAAALAASTSELEPAGSTPTVRVEIDPGLQLDWSTMTIVYRIAQEAVLTAAKHAGATMIGVAISREDGQIVVEVHDDGAGFDEVGPGAASLATMRLLAELGRGALSVESTPGEGTMVRCVLGRHPATTPAGTPGPDATAGRRHLHMVATPDDGD
jgi:signal transduction histidine kinase